MEIDTIQAENPDPDALINYQVEFSTLKRQLLVVLAPVVIAVGFALGVTILGIIGFIIIIFGLWMPFHGIFGYAEVWRFEDQAITRVRRNCLWKGERRWAYTEVKNVRFKERDNHVLPEMRIQGKGWLPLPEQVDQHTAERLKTMIGNFKRATMSSEQAQLETAT